ncbi:Pyruvate/2-oxoglutarate/acetoin dehydrogenase complex, dehydrogenase (E1) component [Hymenobacter gelipurpurascens]|uniref:Pyruvate/2-oxoglutarate/acetoin dehydrogenase complex, dehydrogenase (E1) component n=1 Tax=Hymenobacter gelipurpurascens TaxID=89968 RepID=A0A212TJ91_9BACT|nr:alpha-ketoacid dehydrogenase subunit alpha/beta [Hymenobacter gelipurpurascens]SNC65950.1 Pyruvate/2-oxoglutarate/acetoin dehydrogenase complex, dehydrogenase (E1) component [Hymenobacter gelipurpurascens]
MSTAETADLMATVATLSKEELLRDYRLGWESRHASLAGRKEVFMGKAKFGIFGDGKEVPQLAMARAFRAGDWRSGYYRDQTFMLAIGELTLQQYFAQLYAHPDAEAEPATAGRAMNGHFGTRLLDDDGQFKNLAESKNSSADISPTGGQMPRLVGLAYASKLYRQNPELHDMTQFSVNGNEVAFGTIGNASTSEGMFFEALNAAGVLQIPMLVSVWDDHYGISVPAEYQTTKQNISEILKGLQREGEGQQGFEIFVVKGWDYAALIDTYQRAAEVCRTQHVPVLIHVTEVTQPQGHSTSGSHERYKSKDRLSWEEEHDCLRKMRDWLLTDGQASEEELNQIELEAKDTVKQARIAAWDAFFNPIKQEREEVVGLLNKLVAETGTEHELHELVEPLAHNPAPIRADLVRTARRVLRRVRGLRSMARRDLQNWLEQALAENANRYNSYLYSQSEDAALNIEEIKAEFAPNAPQVDGREVLQACFEANFRRDPRIFAIGEDVGRIGDVNQAFAGLQEKFGELRVTDTGIRECTIVGQGIGAAMRGLRPITEIQYLDYLLYAIQILSDDVASLQYRTKGGQKAPLIVRTRGHRLEGIWHSGSPIQMILGSIRGIHLCVPRDMTQAAGFYNTLLRADEPAIVIECLNGYRLKERIPQNVGEFTVPLGMPEVIREGQDLTIVTYGSMCRIVQDAAKQLAEVGISVEIIDVQTLLPFDIEHLITDSLRKTNRVLFADEDVPGGATAYMMQQVLDEQGAYQLLDSAPRCLSAQAHRPPYGSDGDYFSKPNAEDVFDTVYEMMQESDPKRFASIY